MTVKEKIYYLLNGYNVGEYDIKTFSDIFTNIVNIELLKEECTELEWEVFNELNKYTCRFSPYEEDLCLVNTFFNEKEVKEQINLAVSRLKKFGTIGDACK